MGIVKLCSSPLRFCCICFDDPLLGTAMIKSQTYPILSSLLFFAVLDLVSTLPLSLSSSSASTSNPLHVAALVSHHHHNIGQSLPVCLVM